MCSGLRKNFSSFGSWVFITRGYLLEAVTAGYVPITTIYCYDVCFCLLPRGISIEDSDLG